MNRLIVLLLALPGCAALRPVDRGEWVWVWAAETRGAGAPQELITQEAFDTELVAGKRRKVELAIDEKPPLLSGAAGPLHLKVGQVIRFQAKEGGLDLLSGRGPIEVFWTYPTRADGWKDGQAVEGKVSTVYVLGRSPGRSALKLTDGSGGEWSFEVHVEP